ncbi:MAG: bifunctional adenosylcobinamide kinase/adenosylcobinamide-phosphate guanylyltransferase [Deltaproteobacteria bacterium]|nr:bifunctional adenosylcobinamide kinase/adenosylcobinamide-phosphate guanylyltransferase [Deltaproteobacteria bacterium]
MNTKLIFILGGARSGKSAYALKLAESITGKRLYLATAEALDKEMAERIKKHKKERGNNWTTIEEPINVADVIQGNKKYDVILLDCLTLWISNLMHNCAIRNPQSAISKLVSACKKTKANIIVVSNEVGLGIVPDNPLAREFRDIAGIANQKIAAAADEVYFVAAGIGMRIK